MKKRSAATLALLLLCLGGCSTSPAAPAPIRPDDLDVPAAASGPSALWVGAGDIGLCGSAGPELTARLLDLMAGTVFTAGDNAQTIGSAEEFRNCYHPTWGRHRDRTRPAPGNHDYATPNASAYFDYFGANAGPPGRGYYSYTVGTWHIISLNSEIDASAGSPQERWLRANLAANRTRCTAAHWHRPRFSSGPHGDNPATGALWRALYEFGVEVIVTGHDHSYERFAQQDPDGRHDPARGIRQFVVGTGGATIRLPVTRRPNSEALGTDWGVLVFTLMPDAYHWEFVPVSGASYRDAGEQACH